MGEETAEAQLYNDKICNEKPLQILEMYGLKKV